MSTLLRELDLIDSFIGALRWDECMKLLRQHKLLLSLTNIKVTDVSTDVQAEISCRTNDSMLLVIKVLFTNYDYGDYLSVKFWKIIQFCCSWIDENPEKITPTSRASTFIIDCQNNFVIPASVGYIEINVVDREMGPPLRGDCIFDGRSVETKSGKLTQDEFIARMEKALIHPKIINQIFKFDWNANSGYDTAELTIISDFTNPTSTTRRQFNFLLLVNPGFTAFKKVCDIIVDSYSYNGIISRVVANVPEEGIIGVKFRPLSSKYDYDKNWGFGKPSIGDILRVMPVATPAPIRKPFSEPLLPNTVKWTLGPLDASSDGKTYSLIGVDNGYAGEVNPDIRETLKASMKNDPEILEASQVTLNEQLINKTEEKKPTLRLSFGEPEPRLIDLD